MRAAVLGCGPTGLIAASTLKRLGHDVQIISKVQKSTIGGAQYLHEPVPGVTADKPDGKVSFAKIGSAPGYAEKVYGSVSAPTSWQAHQGVVDAWALDPVYDTLWRAYQIDIWDVNVDADHMEQIRHDFNFVFSSIPKQALCYKEDHTFRQQNIWLQHGSPIEQVPNMVLYSGRKEDAWYRTSTIFGHPWTEYSNPERIPESAVRGFKPLHNDCDCWDYPDVAMIGRFGKWQKGVLIHHVVRDVQKALVDNALL